MLVSSPILSSNISRISLCDANMEDKVKAHEGYKEIKHTRDMLKLLQVKQYMYLNGSEE